MHTEVVFGPVNINQQREKANMFPFCDFTTHETQKQPAVFVAEQVAEMGAGTPKENHGGVQCDRLQTKMRFEVTVQWWFVSSAARLSAMCS